MPRYSDVLTGKQSPSVPVPYNVAISQMSFEAMKACATGHFWWVDELIYRLSFLYKVDKGKVVDDLYRSAEEEIRKLGLEESATI